MYRRTLLACFLLAFALPFVCLAEGEPTAFVDLADGPVKLIAARKADNPDVYLSLKYAVVHETYLTSGTKLSPGSVVLDGDEVIEGAFMNDSGVSVEVLYSDKDGEHAVLLHSGEALNVGAFILDIQEWCYYARCHCCNDRICLADDVHIRFRHRYFVDPQPATLAPEPADLDGQLCAISSDEDGKLQDCTGVWAPCVAAKAELEARWQRLP